MTTVATKSRLVLEGPPRSAGFTLIELMIAMLLGLIVIAGVTSVFLAGQQSFRTNDALAEVQDSSRVAFELMARDIREAGLTGCNSTNGRISNVTTAFNAATPAWWSDWSNVVRGYDTNSSLSDPAATAGSGAGQRVAGTDSLQLISAAGPLIAIASDTGGGFTLNAKTDDLKDGDLAVICSPSQATILRIGYAAGGTDVNYTVAGNCSTNLGYQNNACIGNSPDYIFPPNSLLSRVAAVDWYVGNNPDGGKSLYRISLENPSGTPKPRAAEMVRNVTGMTVTYLDPGSGAIGTTFQPASGIDTSGSWSRVSAVNVRLQVESTFQRASVKGNAPITRTYSFTTTLRNRVN